MQSLNPSFHTKFASHEQLVEKSFEAECTIEVQLIFEQSFVKAFQTKGEWHKHLKGVPIVVIFTALGIYLQSN